MVVELSYEHARKVYSHESVECTTTAELTPLNEIIGQDRAIRALKFGLKIKDKGFNIYVSGIPGTGRRTAIVNFLEEIAKDRPVPSDWCYVNNFKDPDRPHAVELPPGKGREFKQDMERFVSEMRGALSVAFESEEYSRRRNDTLKAIEAERNEVTNQINSLAANAGFLLQRSPIGLVLIPIVNGRPINEQEFAQLRPNLQQQIQERREALQEQLRGSLRQFRDIEGKTREVIRELNRTVASFALEPMLAVLKEKFSECEDVINFLGDVEDDVLDNLSSILQEQSEEAPQLPFPMPGMKSDPTGMYKVNLIVDNSELKGAPVVMEENPSYIRLFGATEKEARFGALVTDFTMIRAGSAHRANGGFIVLPVEGLFANPLVYESLKRTIANAKLEIEEPAERLGMIMTKSISPEPIAFDCKVILVGDPQVYQILYTRDREF
ncbi:ATP-dependent protease, partial [Candidatus Bathyarchaeota archaeon]